MRDRAKKLTALQSDLAFAMRRNQLVLYYQPFFSIRTGQIVGAEALLRWQRSESDLLLPGSFLQVAEDTGLIHEIGEWALRSACEQNRVWQTSGLPPLPVAGNLSARQLRHNNLADIG